VIDHLPPRTLPTAWCWQRFEVTPSGLPRYESETKFSIYSNCSEKETVVLVLCWSGNETGKCTCPFASVQLISETSDKCDVRFFGQHDR